MTENDAVNCILAAIPSAAGTDMQVRAKALLSKAVLKVGRLPGVSWNRRDVTFTTTSGKGAYVVGAEILNNVNDVKQLTTLYRNDSQDDPIPVVSVDEFNKYARGSTSTGMPVIATIHSADRKLELWPIPDSAYQLYSYIQMRITKLDEIPSEYHDVVVDVAIRSINPNNAVLLSEQGLKEIKSDNVTRWDGNTIPVSRSVGRAGSGSKATSWNLRGD